MSTGDRIMLVDAELEQWFSVKGHTPPDVVKNEIIHHTTYGLLLDLDLHTSVKSAVHLPCTVGSKSRKKQCANSRSSK